MILAMFTFSLATLSYIRMYPPDVLAQVKFPDGEVRQCLVPVACLMNHSPWPHVIRYGQIEPGSRRLNFPVFRYSTSKLIIGWPFKASQSNHPSWGSVE